MGRLLGWLLAGLGLLLLVVTHSPITQQVFTISIVGTQQHLAGRLFLPLDQAPPYPLVLLAHGVSSTKETLTPFGIELARHGIAALAYDTGGFGEAYDRPYSDVENIKDARAMMTWVTAHPEQFNLEQLGIVGHSMGGATALELAIEDDRLRVTVVLGMQGLANRLVPPNLLLGAGLYEQFHPPRAMRHLLQQTAGDQAREGQTSGDFVKGTARKLVISPTTDHLAEPFDPILIRQTVDWVQQSFNLPLIHYPLQVPWSILAGCLFWLGCLLEVGYLARFLIARCYGLWWIRAGLGITALTAGVLGITDHLSGIWASNLILLSLALYVVANYRGRSSTDWPVVLRLTGLYGLMILSAYGAVAIVGRLGELLTHPAYWLGIPQFLLQWPVALLYSRYQELRAACFSAYSLGFQVSPRLMIPILIELVSPGLCLFSLEWLATRVIPWLRQPLKLQGIQASRRSIFFLLGSIVVFVGLLVQRSRSGLLSGDTAGAAIGVVSQLALLPGLVMVVAIRQPWFQRWEQRCL